MSIRVGKSAFFIYSLAGVAAAITFACSAPDAKNSGSGENKGDGTIEFNDQTAVNCGDGKLDSDEACDDGNLEDGDGCSATCRQVEVGYICRTPEEGGAQKCIPFAKCGDGVTQFPEQCDDGGRDGGDGCNANCKLEIGFKCEGAPSTCSPTTCGDDIVEGAEMCEPNLTPGCTAQCQFAPTCGDTGPCTSACGDGLVLGEECDDGNNLPGDGCSPDCKVEDGYMCPAVQGECDTDANGACIQKVPVIYRDFSHTHPEFGPGDDGGAGIACGGGTPKLGAVKTELVGGKPVPTGAVPCTTTVNSEWYQDTAKSVRFNQTLTLYKNDAGNYVNRVGANGEAFGRVIVSESSSWSACPADSPCGPYDGNPFFLPLDGLPGALDDGGDAAALADSGTYGGDGSLTWLQDDGSTLKKQNAPDQPPAGASLHNFSFTSEIAYWFAYDQSTLASFEFIGDDDVWVFVNGKLALDLGGRHPAATGAFTLDGSNPNFVGATSTQAAHGMVPGNVYEIRVFHAEREPAGSTFKLTLSGFNTSRSDCTAVCGDGFIGFGEECDDGPDNGQGYNRCSAECTLGDYCGDGKVSGTEECDDADPNKPENCSGCRLLIIR